MVFNADGVSLVSLALSFVTSANISPVDWRRWRGLDDPLPTEFFAGTSSVSLLTSWIIRESFALGFPDAAVSFIVEWLDNIDNLPIPGKTDSLTLFMPDLTVSVVPLFWADSYVVLTNSLSIANVPTLSECLASSCFRFAERTSVSGFQTSSLVFTASSYFP